MIQKEPNDPNRPVPPDHIQEQPTEATEPTGREPVRAPLAPADLVVPRLGPTARSVVVVVCGVTTTVLTLLVVFLLNVFADEYVMGWYANYVIPAGAILVGLAASSGYVVASWLCGRRGGGGLLLTVAVLQVAAYFGAQYLEFLAYDPKWPGGGPMTFTQYYDLTTRSWTWKSSTSSLDSGKPLGGLGYLVRLGEILGFTGAAVLLPLALRALPYCALCERYMKTRQLGLIPAEQPEVDRLTGLANARDVDGFCDGVRGHQANKKANGKLPRRIQLALIRCVQCCGGRLRFTLVEGFGQKVKGTVMGEVALDPEFVRDVAASGI